MDKLLAMRKNLKKGKENSHQKSEEKKEDVNTENLRQVLVETDTKAHQVQENIVQVHRITNQGEQKQSNQQIGNEQNVKDEKIDKNQEESPKQQPKQIAKKLQFPHSHQTPHLLNTIQLRPKNTTTTFDLQSLPSSPSKLQSISQFAQQRKKSKVEMLREKMRLKKISEQENMLSKSIPEGQENQEVREKKKEDQELEQKKKENQESDQEKEAEEQFVEKDEGKKKAYIDPIREAVLFEGMREDHIPVEALQEKQPILEELQHQLEPSSSSPDTLKPEFTSTQQPPVPHTLFYQLKELKQLLDAQYSIKNHAENQPSIKEFVLELQKFKENIQIVNRLR